MSAMASVKNKPERRNGATSPANVPTARKRSGTSHMLA